MEQPWQCPVCGHPIDEPDRVKAAPLRDYHMRTKHGAQNIRPSYGSGSKGSGSSGIIGDIVEGIGEGIGKVIGAIFD